MKNVQKIVVFGAGQMGCGIALVAAQKNISVLLCDSFAKQLQTAEQTIEKTLSKISTQSPKIKDSTEKKPTTIKENAIPGQNYSQANDKADIFQRIQFCQGCPPEVATADFVIEAITENLEAKLALYNAIEAKIAPTAVLATNTSSLSINILGQKLQNNTRFIGMHFMNPVWRMSLVEIITGNNTSEQTLQTTLTLAQVLGKTTATSKDYPGFILNRILLPMLNEAAFTLYEGIADVVSIDTSLKLGANHPMGPLALLDFIGLDTALAIMNILYDGFQDPKYRPCPLLKSMVASGRLGKKNGIGFYDYSTSPPKPAV